MEVWKSIPGYEKEYEVSNSGLVRTIIREYQSERGVVRNVIPGIKKQTLDKDGYKRVTLCKEGKKQRIRTHQLVMLAFIGLCPEKYQVRHLDHSRTNNNLSNLQYGTVKENAQDRQINPSYVHPKGMKGKKHTTETRNKMSVSHRRRNALEV